MRPNTSTVQIIFCPGYFLILGKNCVSGKGYIDDPPSLICSGGGVHVEAAAAPLPPPDTHQQQAGGPSLRWPLQGGPPSTQAGHQGSVLN